MQFGGVNLRVYSVLEVQSHQKASAATRCLKPYLRDHFRFRFDSTTLLSPKYINWCEGREKGDSGGCEGAHVSDIPVASTVRRAQLWSNVCGYLCLKLYLARPVHNINPKIKIQIIHSFFQERLLHLKRQWTSFMFSFFFHLIFFIHDTPSVFFKKRKIWQDNCTISN